MDKRDYVPVPKTVFWSAIGVIAAALLGSYISIQVQMVTLEHNIELVRTTTDKEIKLLKIQVEKDLMSLERIEKQLEKNNDILLKIEKDLVLKQNKKFVE